MNDIKAKETEVQKAILDFLELKKREYNIVFWRNNNIPSANIIGGEFKGFRSFPKYAMKGISDIIVIREDGRVVFIEVKREGTKLISENQKEFKASIEDRAEYYICNSINDIIKIFE